ncbi:DNA utilization protein GntX [Candidatus Fukatsuia symbiotica]|uniref:Amidophosphoribosyltransferase n=1 Tax=Candidatus Fukatsuia symbiotica TaxID=1878942 RepID=A0A2U8I4A8_9GAMM|nr:DNA utilization protein GntX [Candidatus Fukatsuia symbiotica]AWK13958.1 amidophosphoribosyltransferase [Candidatus Fukatsuia symbiotica]MEA9445699.1 DNA utilization protein GntX [Candidatus Fukatsuia symbiotica]
MLTIASHCWLCMQPLYLSHHGICCFCLRNLANTPSCCACCGLPSETPSLPCGRCLLNPPCWTNITFVSNYQPPLSTLIKRMKFDGMTQLAPLLARLLLLRWLNAKRHGERIKPQRIISVPLHKYRCWQRGFNQSDLLARPLARWLNCDYHPRSLIRLHSTPPQQQLNAATRRKNLRGVFHCVDPIRGQHLALLDDVVTTGSTVTEIANLLLAQGAASLQIWCICRTLSSRH